jgi:hypothetical protein
MMAGDWSAAAEIEAEPQMPEDKKAETEDAL